MLRFEADVEKFVRQGGQQDLTFDATLTGYQVLFIDLGELGDSTILLRASWTYICTGLAETTLS